MSTLDRRRFMGQALALSTVPGIAGLVKAEHVDRLQVPGMLALYRSGDECSHAFARHLSESGVTTLALQNDVVRQWRDGLELELKVNNKLLLGLGDWDDYALISGLAAEHRRFPLLAMQHPLGRQRTGWTRQHAGELLALTQLSNKEELERALAALAARNALAPTSPSMFSWVIG